jgi:hypothetical protein
VVFVVKFEVAIGYAIYPVVACHFEELIHIAEKTSAKTTKFQA